MLMGLAGVLFSTALFGSNASLATEGQNVQAGMRAAPLEERMHDQQQAYEAAEEVAANEPKLTAAKAAKSLARSVQSTTHSGAFHPLVSVSYYGDISLLDGSIWNVDPADLYTVLTWYVGDMLVITPNNSWFSNYQFKITNQATGQAVLANMYLGPLYFGAYTNWIVQIDYFLDRIYLNDGTVWRMSPFDSSIISNWQINDTVIIGVNDGVFSSLRPNILINVNMLNYAAGYASY